MTTYKGAVKTIADSNSTDHTVASGKGEGALVHVQFDSYEAATLVQGSLIEIGSKLPLGAYVFETKIAYDALGASTSICLGDAEDDDRYITNTVTTSAGVTRGNTVDGFGYYVDETDTTNTDRQILAKVVDSGSMTGTIKAMALWAK